MTVDFVVFMIALIMAVRAESRLAIALDLYGKQRNYSKVIRKRINVLFFISKIEKENKLPDDGMPIHLASFLFQIIGFLCVIVLGVISVLVSLKVKASWRLLCALTLLCYSIACYVVAVILYRSYKKQNHMLNSDQYDDTFYDFKEYDAKHED